MKNKLLILALITLGTEVYAGGDVSSVVYYETKELSLSQEVPIEPVGVEQIYSEPEIVEEAIVQHSSEELIPPIVEKSLKKVRANGFYVGMGISALHYKTNCVAECKKSGRDINTGLMGRIGYDFNKYIGIEARTIQSTFNIDGGDIKHMGVFLKPMLPLTDRSNIYGLVGLSKTNTDGYLQKAEAEALSLGLGIELDLSKDQAKAGRYNRSFDGKGDQEKGLGVFLDYERMVVKSDAPSLDAVSTGVTYDF